MPHIFFLILVIVGLVYGIFQFFLYIINSLFMIDERFVAKIKNSDSELLNNFIDIEEKNNEKDNEDNKESEKDNKESEKDKVKENKIKILNRALRFDFIICLVISICWFFYPFMLIQLTESQIDKLMPNDKYIGKWLALIVLLSNIFTLRFIKKGKLFTKQYILLCKLLCACIVLITTIIIVINTKKLYISNIISIILISIWLANSATGLLLSHKKMI
jgi:hypothetical protein